VRLALDTNVLAYVEGVNGASRKRTALSIVEKLPADRTFLPVQVLEELFHVLVRKAALFPKQGAGCDPGLEGCVPSDRNLAFRFAGCR
jgi:predicted nucleic acid-binding protein